MPAAAALSGMVRRGCRGLRSLVAFETDNGRREHIKSRRVVGESRLSSCSTPTLRVLELEEFELAIGQLQQGDIPGAEMELLRLHQMATYRVMGNSEDAKFAASACRVYAAVLSMLGRWNQESKVREQGWVEALEAAAHGYVEPEEMRLLARDRQRMVVRQPEGRRVSRFVTEMAHNGRPNMIGEPSDKGTIELDPKLEEDKEMRLLMAATLVAQNRLEQALDVAVTMKSFDELAPEVMALIGDAYLRNGCDGQAADALQAAVHVISKPPHSFAADAHRAAQEAKQAGGWRGGVGAWALNSLAQLSMRGKQPSRAEQYLTDALHLAESTCGSSDISVAQALSSLAKHYMQMSNFVVAEGLYRTARPMLLQALPTAHNLHITRGVLLDYATMLDKLEWNNRSRKEEGDVLRNEISTLLWKHPSATEALEHWAKAEGGMSRWYWHGLETPLLSRLDPNSRV